MFYCFENRRLTGIANEVQELIMISFIHCGVIFAILNVFSGQKTHEIYRSALFARPETIQRADELHKRVTQNVTTPMDKTVEHILQWLQSRFDQKSRNTREEDAGASRDYNKNPNYTLKPQPFTLTRSYDENANNGYPIYETYPTPSFYPYNQNQYPTTVTSASPTNIPSTSADPQFSFSFPEGSTPENSTDFVNNDNNYASYTGAIVDEFTTVTSTINNSFSKPEDNSANELEPSMVNHTPHIHSVDVQCSKDKMVINLEFSDIFNGIVYSKGYYNDPNCHYVTKNSGQNKYSFIVQLNSCGTQFVDEFYKGKQAFLENVLVLQNEPGIQEVWDTIRSVRCLWEGNIKQTLSAGLNVETLNQDILTFSGDMIAARLEIQVGKGPNAPAANGLVKIGETMTLVVTVDGDSAFDILVRSCTATDGNPTSGNLIELTDDQGCILKPKIFGNFQMIKNSDTNKPSVVAFAYFQAFKFPDVMDLLIECNVELCKTQCQSCSQQNEEPVRQKRLVNDGNTYMVNSTKFISEKLHVFSPDDIKFVASSLSNYYNEENQVCFSTTTLYLQNTITIMFFFTSCVIIICFWLKLKKLTEKTIFY